MAETPTSILAGRQKRVSAARIPATEPALARDLSRLALAKIAEMPEPDRVMAERLHAIIKASAPALSPRTWYGTDTFLGERNRRIARRRGSKRAIVAIGRSILVIVWHLLSDPDARFHDLGAGYYAARIDPERRKRTHVRQLEALGYTVTFKPAA